MKHTKRKPCPFCGCEESTLLQLLGSARWRVNCLGCDALGPQAQSERGAARRWNAWAPDKTFEERQAEPEPLRFTEDTARSSQTGSPRTGCDTVLKGLEGRVRIPGRASAGERA